MTTFEVLFWSLIALAGNLLLAIIMWLVYVSINSVPKVIPIISNSI